MELALIEHISPEDWDEAISQYQNVYFYHHSAWLRFLEETQSALPLKFRIINNGKTDGYFVGLLVKKGFIKILGSPMSGWLTEYMGPIVSQEFDLREFIRSLDRLCRQMGIHQVEMGSPLLCKELMQQAGYSTVEWMTFRIPLSTNEAQMWEVLKSKCRNRIRKGRANGLTVEDCDDPAFAEEHYNLLLGVYAKQKRLPPYPKAFFQSLFRHLKPGNLLFSLRVKQGRKTVASGFFPHDHRHVYSLSTASRLESQILCPNEILHWTVMALSGAKGIQEYSMGDNYRIPEHGGRFKDKFNGHQLPVYRFIKSYSLVAKYGREVYKNAMYVKQSLKDMFQ